MPVTNSRSRSKSSGGRRLLFLSLAGVALLSSFVFGVVVGRHWARDEPRLVQTEKGKKSSPAGRRGARELEMERTGQLQEKLTFYQALTAPLAASPSEASKPAAKPPEPTAKLPEPSKAPRDGSSTGFSRPPDERRSGPGSENPADRQLEARANPPASVADRALPGRPLWTVQVGAYRARDMAEELQRSLRAGGYDAYLTTVVYDDGRVHYRVRVGSFADRSQAERAAERLKTERSLVPFVTPK